MAVPKRKVSKARRDKRRSSHWKLDMPGMVKCPHCGEEIRIFGDSHVEEIAERSGIPFSARLPLDPGLAAACDGGLIEMAEAPGLESVADMLEKEVLDWQKGGRVPLIVEVPGLQGHLQGRKTLTESIREAVGISV